MVGPDDVAAAILTNKELMVLMYKDLAQPGVQQVGKALSTVLELCNTALLPIRWGNEAAEAVFTANMERFRQKLADKNIKDVQEVSPELGVPILQQLTYVSDDTLSEMFVNLLATASEQESSNQAHPAFISIINNLAPDEALLLRAMDTLSAKYYGVCGFTFSPNDGSHVLEPSYYLLDPMYTDRANLTFPMYIDSYIRNLERLGIVRTDHHVSEKEVTQMERSDQQHPLGNPITRIKERYSEEKKSSPAFTPQHMHLFWAFRRVEYTEFGRFFRHSCVERVAQPPSAES